MSNWTMIDMEDAATIERIRRKYRALSPLMDERMRRQWAATEAGAVGWGGVTAVSCATGLARNTIAVGIGELEYRRTPSARKPLPFAIRDPGGGRKPLTQTDPGLQQALEALGRSGDARASGIAAALDLQEHRAGWPRN